MLNIIKDVPSNVIGLQLAGAITRQDIDQIGAALAKREDKLRILIHVSRGLSGIDPDALWDDFGLRVGVMASIERCAVVSEIDIINAMTRVIGAFVPFTVKVFDEEEMDEAKRWVSSRSDAVRRRSDGVIVVEPRRSLESEDVATLVQTIDEEGPSLAGVVIRARSFPGWRNPGALLRHLQFVRNYRNKVPRIAVAADGVVAAAMPRASRLLGSEVKRFHYDRYDEAMDWVRNGSRQSKEQEQPVS